ncbi:MAG: NUDIX domain-containing protein [Spirochaetota bacterium]
MERRSIAGIVLRGDTVLIGKRIAGGPIGLHWEFPGGKVEAGETDEEALRREFLEEFEVEVTPVRPLGSSRFQSPSGERLLTAWLVCVEPEAEFHLKEHSRIDWVGLEALEGLKLAGSDRSLIPFLKRSLWGS